MARKKQLEEPKPLEEAKVEEPSTASEVAEPEGKSADVSETESVSAPSSGAETEDSAATAETTEEKPEAVAGPTEVFKKLLPWIYGEGEKQPPRIISTYYNEICRRLGDRVRISKAWHSRPVPALGDSESKAAFDKEYKESTKILRHASYAVNEDMKCLTVALANLQIDFPTVPIGEYVDNAYFAVPRPPEPVDEETETVKKGKDLPGQQKLEMDGGKLKVKDDGSVAEAASECTSRPLEEGEDVSAVEEEPVDDEVEYALADVLNSLTIELVNEIQSMNRESATIVLEEHIAANFPELVDTEEGQYSLAELVIVRVLQEYPPLEDAVKNAAESGESLKEKFEDLGKEIKELGEKKAVLEAEIETPWDEPQRKEPEEEPVSDELAKKREKKEKQITEEQKSPFSLPIPEIYEQPAYKKFLELDEFDRDGVKAELLEALNENNSFFLSLYDWAVDWLTVNEKTQPGEMSIIAKCASLWQLNRLNVERVEALKKPKKGGKKKTEADSISY